jgi:peptide/nickel transport system substrate-binding protein
VRSLRYSAVCLIALITLQSCAGNAPAQPAGSSDPPAAERPFRSLAMAVRYEPTSLASKPLRESGSGVSSTIRLFNAELDLEDGRGSIRPYLAEALPQLNTATWKVFPDARMETTYQLKPNLTWHDGTALTAEDFAFAYRVYTAPSLAVPAGAPVDLMESVGAPDPRTVVIRWRQLYPDAASLTMGFQALPRHLLEASFDRLEPDAFLSHAYWTTEYVGVGPYRLQRWEPGAFVEGIAFDGHALGRPKIDRITVRFFADENVAFTNLLSGEVHYATGRSLRFEHGSGLKRDWDPAQKGTVLFTPDTSRFVAVQLRMSLSTPPGLLDARVRRAIVHAVDRQLLNEGIFDGDLPMSDLFMTRHSRYERLPDMDRALTEADRAITHYPYDVRRTEQLMAEAGYPRVGGTYTSGSGERFSMEVWSHTSPQYEKELAILTNTWQQAGFEVKPNVLPAAALRDNQLRSSFPGLYIASSSRLESFASASIPTAANRWNGSNRGGWANADYDRLWQSFNATLDPTERTRQVIGMLKLLSDEVPAWVLYFNPSVSAHLAALRGPDSASLNSDVWNVYEWELR